MNNFFKSLFSDIKNLKFSELRVDLKDIYNYYIDNETRHRLSKMGWLKRWMTGTFLVLKNIFNKLSAWRRLLLILSVILLYTEETTAAFLILFLILMLELKDKLLAHDELQAGKVVQMALMPEQNPNIPGWDIYLFTRSANDVGGDLVDFLKISDRRYYVSIGDVAGKGLGAALFTAKLQATLRALAPNCQSLSQLGSDLNKIFLRDSIPNRFVSLIYMEIDPNHHQINLLNAGHLPPILIQDSKHSEMEKQNPALGLMKEVKFKKQSIKMNKGDLLLIYSDGLTEALNEEGQFYEKKNLVAKLKTGHNLSSKELGKSIITAIDQFTKNVRQHDDLSFICIKCTR